MLVTEDISTRHEFQPKKNMLNARNEYEKCSSETKSSRERFLIFPQHFHSYCNIYIFES